MSTPSRFLRPMHPKTGISSRPEAVRRILESGWVAQKKIHGHRAQVHVPADPSQPVLVFNRHGKQHKKELSESMLAEVRRVFQPKEHWNVLDAEWLKPEQRLYFFDFLKREGELLAKLRFPERWQLLPRLYLSPHMATLPILKDFAACLQVLQSVDENVEGLVFRSSTSPGFADTSIVRCRRGSIAYKG